MKPEFERRVPLTTVGTEPYRMAVEADDAERAALAKRFVLVAIDRLSATLELVAVRSTVEAHGHLSAAVVQSCVVTGEPVPAVIDQRFALRFVDQATFDAASLGPDSEVELSDDDCDTVAHDGIALDVGEAVAQTLGLALNPFPRCDTDGDGEAERVWRTGDEPKPFAALEQLLGKHDSRS